MLSEMELQSLEKMKRDSCIIKTYGKGERTCYVIFYNDKGDFGNAGMIGKRLSLGHYLPIIFDDDFYYESQWNVPTMYRCRETACVLCLNKDYYNDLRELTDGMLVILFHEYWHFNNNLKRPINKTEKEYWEAKNNARKNFELLEIEKKADDYAMSYIGREKMLSGLREIKAKLENCCDNASKPFELWEIEQRIKRMEEAK